MSKSVFGGRAARGNCHAARGRCRLLAAMAARLAVLTPFAAPSVRGNAITVDRITRGAPRGAASSCACGISRWCPRARSTTRSPTTAPRSSTPSTRTVPVPPPCGWRGGAGVPLLVTATGTDVNQDLFDEDAAPIVRRVLEGAAAVSVFDESMAARIVEALPATAGRLVVIPQSAVFAMPALRPLAAHRRAPAAARPHHPVPGGHPEGEAARASRWSRSRPARPLSDARAGLRGADHRRRGRRGPAPAPGRVIPGPGISGPCRTAACPPSSIWPTWSSIARSPKAEWPTRCSRLSRSAARCSPRTSRATDRSSRTGHRLPVRLAGGAGREGRSPAAGSRSPRPTRRGRPRARQRALRRGSRDRRLPRRVRATGAGFRLSARHGLARASSQPGRARLPSALRAGIRAVARARLREIPASRAAEWRKKGQVVDGAGPPPYDGSIPRRERSRSWRSLPFRASPRSSESRSSSALTRRCAPRSARSSSATTTWSARCWSASSRAVTCCWKACPDSARRSSSRPSRRASSCRSPASSSRPT